MKSIPNVSLTFKRGGRHRLSSRFDCSFPELLRTLVIAAALWLISFFPNSSDALYMSTSRYISFENRISNITGLEICAEVATTDYSELSNGYGTDTYVECPGACPWDQITKDFTWTHFGHTYGGPCGTTLFPALCGGIVNGNETKPGFTCPEVANVRGTCVQSPSNSCNYFGAFVSSGWQYSQHGYGHSNYDVRCAGPDSKTCTWYSDPNCKEIVPPGQAPVAGGGVKCVPLPSNDTVHPIQKFEGWCQEAVDQVANGLKPTACLAAAATPSMTPTAVRAKILRRRDQIARRYICEEKSTATTFAACQLPVPTLSFSGIHEWRCISTCSKKTPRYFLGRRLRLPNADASAEIQCKGPDMTRCSYFVDEACTQLAPGSEIPDSVNESGMFCNQTTTGWCHIASVFLDGFSWVSPYKNECDKLRFTCLRSCETNNSWYNSIQAFEAEDGTIACRGNQSHGCFWFSSSCSDSYLYMFANFTIGAKCTDLTTGWCKDAAEVLKNGRKADLQSCEVQTTVVVASSTVPAPTTLATTLPPPSTSSTIPPNPSTSSEATIPPNPSTSSEAPISTAASISALPLSTIAVTTSSPRSIPSKAAPNLIRGWTLTALSVIIQLCLSSISDSFSLLQSKVFWLPVNMCK